MFFFGNLKYQPAVCVRHTSDRRRIQNYLVVLRSSCLEIGRFKTFKIFQF